MMSWADLHEELPVPQNGQGPALLLLLGLLFSRLFASFQQLLCRPAPHAVKLSIFR